MPRAANNSNSASTSESRRRLVNAAALPPKKGQAKGIVRHARSDALTPLCRIEGGIVKQERYAVSTKTPANPIKIELRIAVRDHKTGRIKARGE